MEESNLIIPKLTPFVFGFIQLIVIIACIILVLIKGGVGAIIMLISSIVSGIIAILRPIIYSLDIGDFMLTNTIFTILSAMFYGLFGLGIFIFALNYRKS